MIRGKKGDLESIFFVIIALGIVGLLLLFISHLNVELYSSFNETISESPQLSDDDVALDTLNEIQDFEDSSLWDYAFLAIFIGYLVVLMLTAFSVRVSPVFFWIYILFSLFGLAAGVMLSNIWEEIATNPEFTATIARFPITNFIIGNYYPIIITGIIAISIIILMGKTPDGGFFGGSKQGIR